MFSRRVCVTPHNRTACWVRRRAPATAAIASKHSTNVCLFCTSCSTAKLSARSFAARPSSPLISAASPG
jgi:hypothetical protein